jgi:hypothetical protein
VKFAAVNGGDAFALAPEKVLHPLPDNVLWARLVGKPVVRLPGWCGRPSRGGAAGRLVASFQAPEAT